MITLYSQPGCRACLRVKDLLVDAGVTFEVVDISKDDAARDFVKNQLGSLSVPVLTSWTDPPIYGYERRLIDKLIENNTLPPAA